MEARCERASQMAVPTLAIMDPCLATRLPDGPEMEPSTDKLHFLSSPFAEPLVLIYVLHIAVDVPFFTLVMENG